MKRIKTLIILALALTVIGCSNNFGKRELPRENEISKLDALEISESRTKTRFVLLSFKYDIEPRKTEKILDEYLMECDLEYQVEKMLQSGQDEMKKFEFNLNSNPAEILIMLSKKYELVSCQL